MFPGALVHQLEQGMGDFLRTSFWSSTPGFDSMIEDFVTDRDAVFRGPYVSVNLPFQSGKSEGTGFEHVPLKYRPHLHQELAFARLKARKNTIVATGTGSGKTECFAVPILAHCADRLSERGIKAIVLYPMNALAADQALRLSQLVFENPKLRGQLNIGMYVGDSEGNAHTVMGATHVITDRDTIRSHPPDILLTNYKMLDYLLMRPEDQVLWRDNNPETLSFLVVDELHTFDGAQGTDLACLIRRLKARLSTPEGYLCAVGTSATLRSDEDAVEALTRYASEVFAEPFDADSVVGETRLTSTEFLAGTLISTDFDTPDVQAILSALNYPDETAFIDAQLRAWFGRTMSPEEALESLKQNVYFRNLLEVMATHHLPTLAIIADKLFAKNTSPKVRLYQTISLLSLASYARGKGQGLQVRLQFWQREMRRMVASVDKHPRLAYHDDLTAKQQHNHLPVVFCRDCGLMGWGTIVDNQTPSRFACDIQAFYKAYFADDIRVKFLFPHGINLRGARTHWLSDALIGQSLQPDFGEMTQVEIPLNVQTVRGKQKLSKKCPQCGEDGLSLLGFQAASLTSTFVSQLFTSKFNHDRRLLTFSDSVQDAAHRAGFFGARTWSFNLRVAILDVVKRHPDLTLAELRKQVPSEWRARLGDEAFVATFIPPNLEWRSDYEKLRESGKLPIRSTLIDLVERRFAWEITSEFTYKSLIGRTLRRTGAAAAYVDQERLTCAAKLFCTAMFEGQNVDVSLEESKQILTGLTARMRDRGAVMTPDLPDEFLESLGNKTYIFGRHHQSHLPKMGLYSRLPILLTDSTGAKFDHPFSNGSWYGRRVAQRLENQNVLLFAADAVRLALDALVRADVVALKQLDGARVWGLLPEAIRITTDLTLLKTEQRRARMFFAAPEAEWLLGMPGLMVDDGDRYVPDAQSESFYANLYASGVVHRVNASEHTGLLKRKERQDIENSFKAADQKPWDINLLSCTPTLEMGIDIGALSSVILCSVPPNVANYVQRMGRAGRRDGNSLVLTIANANPHEMYFFAKPDEMIRGHVATPGVFLNATAVLSRQLTAYCLDCWVKNENVTRRQLPSKVQEAFTGLEHGENLERFPNNFRSYLESHQTELLQGFLGLFPNMEVRTRDAIIKFMKGGTSENDGLAWNIINRLVVLRKERDDRRKEVSDLDKRIRVLEAEAALSPAEKQDLSEYYRERGALAKLVRDLNERPLFQFFSDEGLTPNYAFPEAGVTLKSIIWKRKIESEGEDGQKLENLEYTYERAARSAIVELAPHAKFYAGGRRVVVNQVDVKKSPIEAWRFCTRCTYSSLDTSSDALPNCPACGDTHWSDVGQRRNMLRLSQVFAWTEDSESRIDDERDEREPSFFNREMLVHFGSDKATTAWHLASEAVPFGVEFVPSATFREINFGDRTADGSKLAVAGNESVREGFALCQGCGRVQGNTPQHSGSCKYRHSTQPNDYLVHVFLYREFQSEAVRMLLPFIAEPNFNVKLHSFVAALDMGLQRYFGGRIDHLESTIYSEPIEDALERKQYLVLYDTVPGGTGYLRELVADPDRFFTILEQAQHVLSTCECQNSPEVDGCYKCLFAYRRARDMADTSRTAALEEISKILNARDAWAPIDTLSKISVNSLIESLLEVRWLEALRRNTLSGIFQKKLVKGKSGYSLTLGDYTWTIEPQVDLSSSDGVVYPSRADFVLWPQNEADPDVRPVVIFVDGWTYHKHQLEKDFMQRMAILDSQRFWVWSFTWNDVEGAFQGISGGQTMDMLDAGVDSRLLQQALAAVGGQPWDFAASGFDLLTRYLTIRNVDELEQAMATQYLALVANFPLTTNHTGLADFAVANVVDEFQSRSSRLPSRVAAREWPIERNPMEAPTLRFLMANTPSTLPLNAPGGQTLAKNATVVLWMDDTPARLEHSEARKDWEAILWALNRVQFAGRVFCLPAERQAEMDIGKILTRVTIPSANAMNDQNEWDAVISMAEHLSEAYARKLVEIKAAGLSAPISGYELTANGRTVAMCEAAWPDQRVALIPNVGEDPDGHVFAKHGFAESGWQTFDILEVSVAELQQLLGGL